MDIQRQVIDETAQFSVWNPKVDGEVIESIIGMTFNRIDVDIAKAGFAAWLKAVTDYQETMNNPEGAPEVHSIDAIHQYLQMPSGVIPAYLFNELNKLRQLIASGVVTSVHVVTEGDRFVGFLAGVVSMPLKALKVNNSLEEAVKQILAERSK